MAVSDTTLEYLKGKHLLKYLGQKCLFLFYFPSNIVLTVHVFTKREARRKTGPDSEINKFLVKPVFDSLLFITLTYFFS